MSATTKSIVVRPATDSLESRKPQGTSLGHAIVLTSLGLFSGMLSILWLSSTWDSGVQRTFDLLVSHLSPGDTPSPAKNESQKPASTEGDTPSPAKNESQKPASTEGPSPRIQMKHCKIAPLAQTRNRDALAVADFLAWVDPAANREVDFYLKVGSSHPFLGVTTPVLDTGIAQVSLRLRVVTNLTSLPPLRLGARTLKRGGTEAIYRSWSESLRPEEECECEVVTEEIFMVTGNTDRSPPSAVPSHWLEVFRFNRLHQVPDFLDEHNAGDCYGTVWHVMSMANQPDQRPPGGWAKYCVQIMNVSFDNILTNNVPGGLNEQPYADYASCDKGYCRCASLGDRTIGRQPWNGHGGLREICRQHDPCKCSATSSNQSALHVGKIIIPMPLVRQAPGASPDYLPVDNTTNVTGGWYSFPQRASCRADQRVGEGGCTWRREASYALANIGDFTAHGVNKSFIRIKTGWVIPTPIMLHNADVVKQTFDRGPLALLPCGEG